MEIQNLLNIDFSNIKINNENEQLKLLYNMKDFIVEIPEIIKDTETIIEEFEQYYQFNLYLKCVNKNNEDQLINFLSCLDKFFIRIIKLNKKNFFQDTKDIKYKFILRNNENKNYIKLKLLKNDINNDILKIIKDNSNININELTDKCNISLLLNFNTLWINKNICGIFIKPLLIDKKPLVVSKNEILMSDNDDNSKIINSESSLQYNNIENNKDSNQLELIKEELINENEDLYNKEKSSSSDMTSCNINTFNNSILEFKN